MTDTPATAASPAAASSRADTPSAGSQLDRRSGGSSLQTDRGVTTIASSVVAKIAALAAQEIPGVQAMGKPMARAMGSLRSKIPGGAQAATQGVSVEVGERQAAVDIDIVVYYGHSIVEVAEAIRANVIERLESTTGMEVVEVNVAVDDLFVDGVDGTAGGPASRVE